jgi:hypothetical protein
MNVREMGWKSVEWMHVAQDRNQWRTLVNTVMKLSGSIKSGNILTS